MIKLWRFLVALLLVSFSNPSFASSSRFQVGAGKSDITGPPSDLLMMGYVDTKQRTSGIHSRLWSRAFVILDTQTGNRVALVNTDLISVYQGMKVEVIRQLRAELGDIYDESNVLISATHTHSGPGGFSHYKLYHMVSLGFSQSNFEAVVAGVVSSIVSAHRSLTPAHIRIHRGSLTGISRNRSVEAYRQNPLLERTKYSNDVDEQMNIIRFDKVDGTPIGIWTTFPIHATSVQKTNHLISSDNKGYAAWRFEKKMGKGFIAAFANSNAGDVSPNVAGDLNDDGNWDCPLKDSFECAQASGEAQFQSALQLYESAEEKIEGDIASLHRFRDFSKIEIAKNFSKIAGRATTCPAAVGISMLAGCEDGKGVGKEGVTCSNGWGPFVARGCAIDPCHGEKPIALALGYQKPAPWTPEVLPVQMVRLGQLVLVAVPAEFTTMAGRRLTESVQSELASIGISESWLAGYANAYAGYVATREEYQIQHYEGASTHFGEWTLAGYQTVFRELAKHWSKGEPLSPSLPIRDLSSSVVSLQPRVPRVDRVPEGVKFGDVIVQPHKNYNQGQKVSFTYWAANLNRDFFTDSSYFFIEKLDGNEWKPVRSDDDWDTEFRWNESSRSQSQVEVVWNLGKDTASGVYRIRYQGVASPNPNTKQRFSGYSNSFEVTQ